MEKLRQDAHEKLKIGTKKEAVIRFFAESELPVSFYRDEASGTVNVKGCAPSGCGSDDFILLLRVHVDKEGTVISDAVVEGIYTNCV